MGLGPCSPRPTLFVSVTIEGTKQPHEHMMYKAENDLTLTILSRTFLVIKTGLSEFSGKAIPFDTLLDILGLIHDASALDGRRPSS